MTASARVGVVIVARNCADHLAEAIQSVLEQEPLPADIVVLDGGSIDSTAEVARQFEAVRVIPQIGLGLGAARNQALGHVEGEFLAFCDCDDQWRPNSLALRLDHLHENRDCDAVIGRVATAPLDGEAIPERRLEGLHQSLPGYTPGALLARRRTFDDVGPFSGSLRVGTDSDWFVRLLQSDCRLDEIGEVVLTKGVRESALSVQVDTYREEMLLVARHYIDRRRSRP